MTLTEHLEELRWCLLKSLAAITLASGLCYFFSDAIFRFTVAPLRQSLRPGQSLIGTGVTEAFFIEIKVAIAGGVFFSCPVIFYQIWRFIAPGLSGAEKRLVLPGAPHAIDNEAEERDDDDGAADPQREQSCPHLGPDDRALPFVGFGRESE